MPADSPCDYGVRRKFDELGQLHAPRIQAEKMVSTDDHVRYLPVPPRCMPGDRLFRAIDRLREDVFTCLHPHDCLGMMIRVWPRRDGFASAVWISLTDECGDGHTARLPSLDAWFRRDVVWSLTFTSPDRLVDGGIQRLSGALEHHLSPEGLPHGAAMLEEHCRAGSRLNARWRTSGNPPPRDRLDLRITWQWHRPGREWETRLMQSALGGYSEYEGGRYRFDRRAYASLRVVF